MTPFCHKLWAKQVAKTVILTAKTVIINGQNGQTDADLTPGWGTDWPKQHFSAKHGNVSKTRD